MLSLLYIEQHNTFQIENVEIIRVKSEVEKIVKFTLILLYPDLVIGMSQSTNPKYTKLCFILPYLVP